jgi:CHAT domain-containing protein
LTDEYAALGDYDSALEYAHQALAQAESGGSNFQVYFALSNLASLHDDWGNFALAISHRKRALQVAEQIGNPQNKYWAAYSLSTLLMRMGDSEGAAAHAERARKVLAEKANKEVQNLVNVYLQLANIHGDRSSSNRDPDKAKELFQMAMAEAETVGLESVKVSVKEDLADFYAVEGQYGQAIELFESVALHKERANDSYGLAFTLLQLSESYAKSGRLKDAQSAVDRAEPLVKKQNDVYLTGNLYYFRASLLKAQGRLREALVDYKRTTDLIEEARGSLSGQARVGISGAYEFVYDEFIDALYRLYGTAPDTDRGSIATRALRVSEENKARQFSETLGAVYLREGTPGVPQELIRKERSLTARRNTLVKRLAGSREAESVPFDRSSFFAEIQTIEQEMDELIRTLRNDFPSYAALKYPAAVDLADLQLRDGELVLVYNTGREATFLWVLRGGPNGALVDGFHKLQVNSAKLEQLVQKFRRPFSGQIPHLSQFNYETSEELFDVLLSAVGEEKLKEYERIFIIPDGDLYLIPFEALSPRAREAEYVLDSMPISYFPSATAMALARIQRPRSPPSALLFAVGDPVSDPSDERILFAESPVVEQLQPEEEADAGQEQVEEVLADLRSSGFSFYRLPATGREVRAISQALSGLGGDVEVRLGFEATKKGLLATDLSRFRFLHFATHGILPKEVSFIHEPALVLSMEGTDPRNMFLTMSDVLNLRLNAEVVTLSACETGLGKNVRSEGIIGLPRAFMFAGASSVVVSLWKVADDSTAEFMKEFYSNIAAGKDKAASLALARHRLRESGKDNPFFWAPFIMWGE